jgi:hypothetical protein
MPLKTVSTVATRVSTRRFEAPAARVLSDRESSSARGSTLTSKPSTLRGA